VVAARVWAGKALQGSVLTELCDSLLSPNIKSDLSLWTQMMLLFGWLMLPSLLL